MRAYSDMQQSVLRTARCGTYMGSCNFSPASFFSLLFFNIMSSAFILESRNKTLQCLFRSHEGLFARSMIA